MGEKRRGESGHRRREKEKERKKERKREKKVSKYLRFVREEQREKEGEREEITSPPTHPDRLRLVRLVLRGRHFFKGTKIFGFKTEENLEERREEGGG